jgi:hypothetical protein
MGCRVKKSAVRHFLSIWDRPTERRPGFGAPGIVSQWLVMQPSPLVYREQGDPLRTSPHSHRVLDTVKTVLQSPKIGRPSFFEFLGPSNQAQTWIRCSRHCFAVVCDASVSLGAS